MARKVDDTWVMEEGELDILNARPKSRPRYAKNARAKMVRDQDKEGPSETKVREGHIPIDRIRSYYRGR